MEIFEEGVEGEDHKKRNGFARKDRLIADIYISISMGTFEHRKYKSRGEDGNK